MNNEEWGRYAVARRIRKIMNENVSNINQIASGGNEISVGATRWVARKRVNHRLTPTVIGGAGDVGESLTDNLMRKFTDRMSGAYVIATRFFVVKEKFNDRMVEANVATRTFAVVKTKFAVHYAGFENIARTFVDVNTNLADRVSEAADRMGKLNFACRTANFVTRSTNSEGRISR